MNKLIKGSFLAATLCAASLAQAATHYKIKVTNGSGMPISPGVVYVTANAEPLIKIGSLPTVGFTRLCQTGNPDVRITEINKRANVIWSQKTSGPILPGQTFELRLPISNRGQSIHFEAMYGKTKDTCAVYNLNTRHLARFMDMTVPLVVDKDEVVSTGAFLDPAISAGHSVGDVCQAAASAVDCLRLLAEVNQNENKIRFFPGYLPSVLNALEEKYDAQDVQSLMIPTSGALRIQVFKD